MEYARILHLAATTMEATVDSALDLGNFDYAAVKELAEPRAPEAPLLSPGSRT